MEQPTVSCIKVGCQTGISHFLSRETFGRMAKQVDAHRRIMSSRQACTRLHARNIARCIALRVVGRVSAVDGIHWHSKGDPDPDRQPLANASWPQVLPASAVGGKYRLYLPAEFVASARLQPGTIQVLPVRPYQLVAANSHRAAVIRGCR